MAVTFIIPYRLGRDDDREFGCHRFNISQLAEFIIFTFLNPNFLLQNPYTIFNILVIYIHKYHFALYLYHQI